MIPFPLVWQLVHPISQPVFLGRRLSSCGIWGAFVFAHCFWSAGGMGVNGMTGCPGVPEGRAKLPLSTMSASLPGTGMWSEKFILATQPAMADKGS